MSVMLEKCTRFQRLVWTPEADSIVRDCYSSCHRRPPVKSTANRLGISYKSVRSRAIALGLAEDGSAPIPWTRQEIRILEETAAYTNTYTVQRLRDAGFKRTENAVSIYRRKRVGHREDIRIDTDTYSTTQLAQCLGVSAETVSAWVRKGWLKAKSCPGSGREVGAYLIQRAAVRQFVINFTAHVRFTEENKFWLVDLLR